MGFLRHCEERSDEAICLNYKYLEIASLSLAMTSRSYTA
jgi:hypothetical protein